MLRPPNNTELRHVSNEVGVGLFSTKRYTQNECVFIDAPFTSIQHSANQRVALSCNHCFKHVGGSLGQMEALFMDDAFSDVRELAKSICEASEYVKCDCGLAYCSEECRQGSWKEHHWALCVANSLNAHGVTQFKMYCLEVQGCGDTLLLAGQTLVKIGSAADNNVEKLRGMVHDLLSLKHLPFQQVNLFFYF